MESLSTATLIFTHWHWLIGAAVLASAEMLAPGYFLIWIGSAAAITGVLTWLLPIGWPVQVLLFVILSGAVVMAVRRYMQTNPLVSTDENLNRRAERMVGDVVTVVDAISNGQGKVKVADSPWIAKGPDAAVGDVG